LVVYIPPSSYIFLDEIFHSHRSSF